MTDSTEIQTQSCPKCSEESPEAAVMCWACYSPLGNAKLAPFSVNQNAPEVRFSQPSWWRDNAQLIGSYAILGALVSSGWWRGKTRFYVAGAGALAVAIMLESERRLAQKRKQHQADWRDEGSAMGRFADQILLFAIRDNASQVRIIRGEGDVEGQYLVDGNWQGMIRFPRYAYPALQNEFSTRGESGRVSMSASGRREGAREFALSELERDAAFALRILIEPPRAELLLTRL